MVGTPIHRLSAETGSGVRATHREDVMTDQKTPETEAEMSGVTPRRRPKADVLEVGGRRLSPSTLMMGHAFDPMLSEGSLKPPIFLTSTFVFENAQQGKDFFDLTAGRRQPRPGEKSGLVYSRFNNPNLEILEDRLAIWDQAERSAVFASGMAAVSTTLLAFLRPGDAVLHSRPLYGGTETLLKNQMGAFGITPFGFP